MAVGVDRTENLREVRLGDSVQEAIALAEEGHRRREDEASIRRGLVPRRWLLTSIALAESTRDAMDDVLSVTFIRPAARDLRGWGPDGVHD